VEVLVKVAGRREPGALKSFLAGGVGGMCVVLTGYYQGEVRKVNQGILVLQRKTLLPSNGT